MRNPAIFFFLILFFSCNYPSDNLICHEALAQFPEPLQTHLKKIIAENMLYNGLMWEEPKTASSESYVSQKTSTINMIREIDPELNNLEKIRKEAAKRKPVPSSGEVYYVEAPGWW